jgi:DNA-binding response OmpR family regulator
MSNKFILIVEDNPDDEELLLMAFRKNEISTELIIMRDGAEALDFIFKKGKFQNEFDKGLPSLIILDLKIPKVDGSEVLHSIKSSPSTVNIPVIILSSSGEKNDIYNSYKSGANSYLIKPIDFNEFKTLVHCINKFWIEFNELPKSINID